MRSIKHVLYKHWLKYPELANETIFYHDCDIAFAKPIDFSELLNDDTSYLSDTVSYIGAKYIRSKGEHYLDLMTSIVNVNKEYVILNEQHSGGAQYLIKNVSAEFWKKVYYDSENLFRLVNEQIKKDNPPHALQIWCADMWAVLWNIWKLGIKTECHDDLLFAWGTSPIEEWDRLYIFHNAGVVGPNSGFFYKSNYMNRFPYNENLNINESTASYKYWQ